MRVITGIARGRRLKEPAGLDIRPTTDRVKEGLFSAIQFRIGGSRLLDLFAGTGQLGIECLSRGAAAAVFVDHRAQVCALVRENLALTGLSDRARVVTADALAYLSGARERFDLIFLDPPYEAGLLERCVRILAERDLLNPDGIAALEHPAGRTLPDLPAPYGYGRTYRYGKIAVTLCHRPGGTGAREEGIRERGVSGGAARREDGAPGGGAEGERGIPGGGADRENGEETT